jgi:hypothetical protein
MPKMPVFVDNVTILPGTDNNFKKKFYPRGWAKYDEAKPGTFRLNPPAHSKKKLESDYKTMKEMIYGDYPDFETLMQYIEQLENEINALWRK